jgi:hemoglobin/transferrin/lactoferrin receptor protein
MTGRRHAGRAGACGLAAAALWGIGAAAQETGAAEPLVAPEITVFGAARDARDLLETPNAVSVIGEQEVIRRNPSTFAELIGDLPGVTIDGGPRGVSQEPNIRGFRDEQVVIRLDGARQNFNLAHRGRFFTDPTILKQVEVLRGGASTLFGSGALGGVIFLETKDPSDILAPGDTWGGEARLGFNSQGDELLGAGTLAGRAGDFDALAFFAGRPRFSDIEDGDGDPIIDSEIDSYQGLFKLGWEPDGGHRVELTHQEYRDSGETPPNTNAQGSPTTTVDRSLRFRSTRLEWDWIPAESPLVDLNVLAYRNDTRVEEDRLFDGRLDETDFETLGIEATNVSRVDLGLPVALSYGIEVYRDAQEATRDGADRAQTPDASQSFQAGFVQADVALTETLTVTPGIRVDRFALDPDDPAFEDRSEIQPSPKLALSWRPVEDAQLWVSGARSFRAPSLTELYPDGVHFSVPGFPLGPGQVFTGVNEFEPNPDLEPEIASQVEIGGRWRMRDLLARGDRLTLEGNLYYARVEDFIDSTVTFIDFSTGAFNPMTGQLEVGGTTTSRNVDAELYGFEASVSYESPEWFAGVGLTIPRGEGEDGAELASIPQDRLVVTGGWRPVPDVEIGARGTFAAGIDADDVPEGALTTSGFAVFDVFANWAPAAGPLEGAVFSAGIDNLTDRDYRVHPSGLDSPGLTVKLAASIRF